MHNGIDISHYQDTTIVNNQFVEVPIDWDAVATDPLNIEYVYIKAAHGAAIAGKHADAYPREIYLRQYRGAGRIKRKRGPYHYWYRSLNGVKLKPKDQAYAFRESVRDEVGELAPMSDVEDDQRKYLDFHDTASANKALAFALEMTEDLFVYFDEIERLFSRRPVLYSGPWWMNPLTRLLQFYHPDYLTRLASYLYAAADYTPPLDQTVGLQAKIWQRTSIPNPPVNGFKILDGYGVLHLDVLQWVGSEEEYQVFIGETLPPVVTEESKLEKLWAAHPELHG